MKKLIFLLAAAAFSLAAQAFTTDTIQVKTKYLASPEDVTVITPDHKSGDKFPTVYLLNGYSGNHKDWTFIQPRLGELADSYGFVIVMPDGRDTWYWDSPVDPDFQMESFFIKDLVPYIDANYPTVNSRNKRAISGLSMGGHGALWLALNHPDVFGSAASMSGGVDIRPFPKNWKMAERIGAKDEFPARWDEYTVATKVDKIKDADLNLLVDCGSDDFFYEVNLKLHNDLLAAGVKHDYICRPGGHTFEYWNNSVLYHLLFFNEAFNKK